MKNLNDIGYGHTSVNRAMSNFILTSSEELKKTEDYAKVCQVIYRLMESGVTFAAKGYCISMSDIVYTMLNQVGVKCKIVECKLSITNKINNEIYVVGFDGLKDVPNGTDTHVVVITETEIPMLIDVSIAHLLPNNIQGVIDEVKSNSDIIANIHSSFADLTYQEKKTFGVALLHQTSIVDRINTDMSIFQNIKFLKILVVTALIISLFNAVRGAYDYYQVYFIHDNDWGPSAVRELNHRLDVIDEKLQINN